VFILAFSVGLIFVADIYQWFIKDFGEKLVVLGPTDILWIYFMISGVFALIVTITVAAFETWRFVKPGLTKDEQRATLMFVPSLFVLFLVGISFGYFVLFPIVFAFLTTLSAGQYETMFTVDKYFRFLMNLTLPFGFLFEMPVVVMFLTMLGFLNPLRLAKVNFKESID
jgi:sec-independent protein translocase protein TatC